MGKIKDFFENAIDYWRSEPEMMLGGHFLFIIVGIAAFGIGSCIDYGVSKSQVKKLYKECEEYRLELGENISSQTKLDNFNVASYEVISNFEGEYLLKMFGIEKFTQNGITESAYKNVMFNISESDANLILEKTKKINNCEINASFMTKKEIVEEISLASNKDFNEYKNVTRELYDALNKAVERSYGYRVENVFEASAMNNRISNSYRVFKPEILTDVDGRFVYSEFVKSGIITSGVSMVYEDDERNVSFFYIDTIQAMPDENGNLVWVPCKARVEVEGVNLLTEDVYASFIKGEHLSFTELGEDRDLKAGSEVFNLG